MHTKSDNLERIRRARETSAVVLEIHDIDYADFLGICTIRSLKELHITSPRFRHVGDEVASLKKLKVLTIKQSCITTISERIMELKHLETLDIESTEGIARLLKQVSFLSKHTKLKISSSNRPRLPKDTGGFSNFLSLRLEYAGCCEMMRPSLDEPRI